MSWDNLLENTGYWLEVASNRMARRALHTEAKSLAKFSEDEAIQEWIAYMPEKMLTKSLKRDTRIILARITAEKAVKTTSKQDKSYPEDSE